MSWIQNSGILSSQTSTGTWFSSFTTLCFHYALTHQHYKENLCHLHKEATRLLFFFQGYKKEQQRIWMFLGLLCTNIPLLHLLTVQICAVWNQNRAAFQTQDAGSCWILCFKCVLGHADSSKLSAPNHLTDENEFVAVTDLKRSSEQVSAVGMINVLRTVLNLSWGWQLRCEFEVLVQRVLAVNYSSTEIAWDVTVN